MKIHSRYHSHSHSVSDIVSVFFKLWVPTTLCVLYSLSHLQSPITHKFISALILLVHVHMYPRFSCWSLNTLSVIIAVCACDLYECVCCRGMSCRSYCSVELLMWIKHNIDDSSQFTIVCLPTEFRVTRVACVHCQCSVSRMFQWICRTVLRSGPIIASGQNEFSLYYLQTHMMKMRRRIIAPILPLFVSFCCFISLNWRRGGHSVFSYPSAGKMMHLCE